MKMTFSFFFPITGANQLTVVSFLTLQMFNYVQFCSVLFSFEGPLFAATLFPPTFVMNK